MPDELLTIFKLCFLALLYLFFFRVLRAVWTQVSAPAATVTAPGFDAAAPTAATSAPAAAATPSRRERRRERKAARVAGPSALTVVEPPHLAGIEYGLVDGLVFGRAADASIVLDDSFASSHHARLDLRDDGSWALVDLGSTNGTFVNDTRITAPVRISVGDRLQVGNTVLDVR